MCVADLPPLASSPPASCCCSGVVWYNQMKLAAIKSKVASDTKDPGLSGGGKGDEESKGVLTGGRSKEDLMGEIRRLQNQMNALENRLDGDDKEEMQALGQKEA